MAQLNFHIRPRGDYYCTYSLEVWGTQDTAFGLGEGCISIPTLSISNFSLTHYSTAIPFSKFEENGSSFYQFFLNYSLHEGTQTTLEGRFEGTSWSNESSRAIYHLGIDWGTIVPLQNARVRVDREKFKINSISPEGSTNTTLGSQIFFEWNDYSVQGFSCTLGLESQTLPFENLLVDVSFWNGTPGQNNEFFITNIGFFEIEGFILPTPSSWLSVNVSKFLLAPSQKIPVLFSISDTVTSGVNGSIEIILIKWLDREDNFFERLETIIIPVYVYDNSASSPFLSDFFFPLSLLFVLFSSSYVVFQQKKEITRFVQTKVSFLKDIPWISNSSTFLEDSSSLQAEEIPASDVAESISWDSVESRWKTILPDRELQLLEILLKKGRINQQTLANEMGVSKGTMSRIVSRLEMKNLLVRERFGVSKMIRINKDRL
jgi:hypothetical protein